MSDNVDRKTMYDSVKIYPEMRRVVSFKIGFDITIKNKPKSPQGSRYIFPFMKEAKEKRANRHASSTIFDIVMCNQFTHFTTFTFDPKRNKKADDISVCKLIMHRWLESQRKKYGKFDYLIVAERQKNGNLHFHGLFADFKGVLTDSGVRHGGRPVYNLTGWRHGFSTAKLIDQNPDSRIKVAGYMKKYISKDFVRFAGGKRFWVSQGLKRPEKLVNDYHENQSSEIYCAT